MVISWDLFCSIGVLENVDKAQTKIKMRKDNVAGITNQQLNQWK